MKYLSLIIHSISIKITDQIFKFCSLFIIPIAILINIIAHNKGSNDYDPDYIYLMNGLNLTNSHWNIGYYYHPGTPVIIISAIIIKISYPFRKTNSSLQTDVLINSHYYLRTIKNTFLLINCLLILGLGFFIYIVTNELIYGLLFQSIPLFSKSVLIWSFYKVSPEPLIFGAVIILLIVFLTKYYFLDLRSKSLIWPRMKQICQINQIHLFGIILGFCFATKINTLPLLLIPLIFITGNKNKFYLLIISFISFIIFTLPIAHYYFRFLYWIYNLLIHSGYYGGGEKDIINLNSFYENFISFIMNEPVMFFILFFTLLTIIKQIIQKHFDIELKILTTLFLVQLIVSIMVLKHFYSRYFIPIIPTLAINLFLIFKIFNLSKKPKILIIIFFISVCVFLNLDLKKNFTKVYTSNNFKDCINIYAFGSMSPIYALKYGDENSSHFNSYQLEKIYGKQYFYNFWDKQLTDWSIPVTIETLLKHNKRIILNTPEEFIKMWGTPFKLKLISEGRYLIENN